MGNSIDIIVRLRQAGGRVLDNTVAGLRRVNMASRAYHATVASMGGSVDRLTGSLMQLAGVLGGAELFRRAISSGFQFNDTVEQSRIGIAALVRTFNDFSDAQGNVADGATAYAKSMAIAEEIQQKLQIEGLKTTATYEQLLRALQEGIGPAFKAGFNPDQVVQFTSKMTQTAAAISLPMDQLGQELRAILDGTIDRNARIAKVLGLTNAKIKELAKNGDLFDFLMLKMDAFAEAGEATARTYSGAWSNVVDAVQLGLGRGLKESFDSTTKLFLKLKDAIVVVDKATSEIKVNPQIVAALGRIDEAIVNLLGNGKNLDKWVERIADTFANVAVAVLQAANVLTKLLNAIGPILPGLLKFVTYLALVKGALFAVIGLPLSLGLQIKGLAVACKTLGLSQLITWLGSLRVALAAATAQTTALSLAFKGIVALAAAYGIIQIGRLVKVLWEWRNAANAAREAQERLYKTMSKIIDKHRDFKDLRAPEDLTGKAPEELEELRHGLLRTRAYFVALQAKLYEKSKERTIFGRTTEAAREAQAALVGVRKRLQEVKADLARLNGGKSTEVIVKPKLNPNDDDAAEAAKKIKKDRERLEKQLANDLAKIDDDKWVVLRNQAKKHYDDQVKLAHGNKKLLAQAEKVYTAKLKKINADREREMLKSTSRSQMTHLEETTQTALEVLENTYEDGEITLIKYFERRKELIGKQFQAELAALRALAEAEPDPIKKQELNDQVFAKEQAHRRAMIELAHQQKSAEKELDKSRKSIERSIANIRQRTLVPTSDLSTIFTREHAEMDQLHAEEMDRLEEATDKLKDETKKRALITEASNQQELEKKRLLADQDRRLNEYRLQNTADLAGSMSDIFQNLYEATGENSKELFYISKAAAIAEATIKAYLAANKALSDGGPIMGKIQAATILAAAMANVAKIKAQQLATGGPVLGYSPHDKADNVPIWATAGEFMHPVSAVRYYGRGFMEAIRRRLIPRELFSGFNIPVPNTQSSFALASGGPVPQAPAGGGFSVTVPVSITGGNDRIARILPDEIEQAVIRVMRREMR